MFNRFDVDDSDDSSLPSKKMKEEKPKPAPTLTNKDVTRNRTPSVNIYRPPAARIAETKSSTTVTEEIKAKDARYRTLLNLCFVLMGIYHSLYISPIFSLYLATQQAG